MILIIVAAVAAVILGGWCIVTNSISLSQQNAKLCKSVLLALSILGLAGAVLSTIIFNVTASGAEDDSVAFARDTFNAFALAYTVFIALGFIITLLSSLLKTKFRAVIVVVLPMWALIGLFFTFLGYMWLSFSDAAAALCAAAFGISLSSVLSFPAFLEIREREKILCNRTLRYEIIKARREKKVQREIKTQKRKSLREKKKKLKNRKK